MKEHLRLSLSRLRRWYVPWNTSMCSTSEIKFSNLLWFKWDLFSTSEVLKSILYNWSQPLFFFFHFNPFNVLFIETSREDFCCQCFHQVVWLKKRKGNLCSIFKFIWNVLLNGDILDLKRLIIFNLHSLMLFFFLSVKMTEIFCLNISYSHCSAQMIRFSFFLFWNGAIQYLNEGILDTLK